MAVSVSFINMKGGVGKTTLAFNYIWYAAYTLGLRVLAVDLDPQANLSQYLLGASRYLKFLNSGEASIVNVFEQFTAPTLHMPSPSQLDAEQVIRGVRSWTDGSGVDLLPSRLELSWTLKNPTDKSHLLAKFLARVTAHYDLVVIDCAPTESMLTTAAYRACSYVVVPVKPEFLSIVGLPLLARSIAEFKASFGDQQLEIAGVAINDGSKDSPDSRVAISELRKLCKSSSWPVLKARLQHSDSFPRGARSATPIFQTKYARDDVKTRFNSLANELSVSLGL